MGWQVIFHPEFFLEFGDLPETTQDDILAKALMLQQFGPQLGRPHADILHGSHYSNMKELRLDSENGIWRVAFAFDLERKAILLIAGNKAGMPTRLFYKHLIHIADKRFNAHLIQIQKK